MHTSTIYEDGEQKMSRKAGLIGIILLTALIVASVSISKRESPKPAIHEDWSLPDDPSMIYQCSAGMYRKEPEGCLYCPAGSLCLGGLDPIATLCPVGEFQSLPGKKVCDPTRPGYITDTPGSTSETPCPMGRYQPLPKESVCLDSRIGHKVPTTGSYRDTPCPPNTFQPAAGQSDCLPCPANQHQPFVGQSSCMAKVAIPWASLVPFTSFASLQTALGAHGCPDGLSVSGRVYSTIEMNPCTVTGASISIKAYGGTGDNIVTNTLAIASSDNGITCTGSNMKWGAAASATFDCSAWADFAKVKLIYATGSAGRTFQSMIGRSKTMVDALTNGYAPAIQISFATDGRLVEMNSYQVDGALVGSGFELTRYYKTAGGNQFSLKITDTCTYCEFVAGGASEPCQSGKAIGDVINVKVFSTPTTFKCGDDVSVQLPFVATTFYKGPDRRTWAESKAYCEAQGDQFAVLDTVEKNMAAYDVCGVQQHCWIGLNDLETTNVWKWVDGTVAPFLSFDAGEPNNPVSERCVLFWQGKYKWNDGTCGGLQPFVCEKVAV